MCGLEWRWCDGGCGLVALSSLSSSFLFVVGVRGGARAALRARTLSPNTIVFPVVLVLSSFLPLPALSFVVGMAVGVFTMCRCVRWA